MKARAFVLKYLSPLTRKRNKKAVLIIDDEEHIRKYLKEYLESNYTVYSVPTIEKAKVLIEKQKLDYAIIDLKLDNTSEYGGIQVFQFLKRRQPDVKVIILSAYYFDEDVEEEFKRHLKEETESTKLLKEARKNYISKGGEKNYILAVLEKLKSLDRENQP